LLLYPSANRRTNPEKELWTCSVPIAMHLCWRPLAILEWDITIAEGLPQGLSRQIFACFSGFPNQGAAIKAPAEMLQQALGLLPLKFKGTSRLLSGAVGGALAYPKCSPFPRRNALSSGRRLSGTRPMFLNG
jgi:hypothetical protein